MKLRISENFLRFRLTKSDVAAFNAGGRIEGQIRFGAQSPQGFSYELVKSDVRQISADFKDGKITVLIPQLTAENWIESGEVGFEEFQIIDAETSLKILVEKDFAFLKPKPEDDADNFPHPLKPATKI